MGMILQFVSMLVRVKFENLTNVVDPLLFFLGEGFWWTVDRKAVGSCQDSEDVGDSGYNEE
jgi:hypothetical protein